MLVSRPGKGSSRYTIAVPQQLASSNLQKSELSNLEKLILNNLIVLVNCLHKLICHNV